MKCGISFVSIDGARNNLEQELPHWNFEKVRKEAQKSWNKALSCIEVKGKSERDKRIFYTGLYHTMIDPRCYSDVDGNYVGADGQIHQAKDFVYRTIFSGWDVFRSQFPLQNLINPAIGDRRDQFFDTDRRFEWPALLPALGIFKCLFRLYGR